MKHAILIVMIILVSASMLMAEGFAAPQHKSKTAAAAYSLVTTLVPEGISILFLAQDGNHSQARNRAWFAFGLSGPVFGPGVGHLYACNTRRYNNGTLLRLCLSTLGITALYSNDESDLAGVIALSTGVMVTFSMIYDIATVGKSVDKYNHGHGFSNLRIQPQYFAATRAVGCNVSMSF
jgi:hypothetical protein